MLTLGSLFDGIGGWQLAAVHAGVKPIWSSEIEKFPLAVTRKRFPDTKQLGDVTKITDVEPVDIVCAGSPCQDLSIAGKREGLAGERSGLFINAINIVRQMRMSTGGRQPRFFIWENVPGAFTSGSERGADFRAVLESIAETDIPMPKDGRWANAGMVQCPKCEIAWRVLDAQFWGVPQRRKRIFLVADFAATDRRAGKILFVEQSLSGNTEQSRETRKRVASTIEKSIRTASELVHRGGTFDIRISSEGTHNWRAHCYETDKSRSLDTHAPDPDTNHGGVAILEDVNLSTVGWQNERTIYDMTHAQDVIRENKQAPTLNVQSNRIQSINGKAAALYGGAGQGTHNGAVFDTRHIAYSFDSLASNSMKSKNPHSGCRQVEVSKTLDTTTPDPSKNQGGVAILEDVNLSTVGWQNERTIYDMTHAQDVIRENKQAPTLNARMETGGNQVPILTENIPSSVIMGHDERSARFHTETTDPLTACDYKQPPIVATIVFEPGVATRDGGHVYTEQSRASNNVQSNNVVRQQYAVRRLTPLECERLQGLPDGWTLIDDKSCSDSARYKAIGNGMAQPCADYVIQRIVDEVGKT